VVLLVVSNHKNSSAAENLFQSRNVPIGTVVFFVILIFLKVAKLERSAGGILHRLYQMDPCGAATPVADVCCLFLALQ
jgi:ribosomal protein L2